MLKALGPLATQPCEELACGDVQYPLPSPTTTLQVNGQSPCTPDVDHRCPGPFDDFTCVDENSYCLGGTAAAPAGLAAR